MNLLAWLLGWFAVVWVVVGALFGLWLINSWLKGKE